MLRYVYFGTNSLEKAVAFYATLNAANRYAIVYRLHSAKKAETRQKREERALLDAKREGKIGSKAYKALQKQRGRT